MSAAYVVNMRGWPGLAGWDRPPPPKASVRLSSRVALVVFAAADLGAEGDGFGMGGVLVAHGRSLSHSVLLVPDDLRPERRSELDAWADSRLVETVLGAQPWWVVTTGE